MKTKPPTQLELATLAVNLPTGSPDDRVYTAHLIWDAAGKRLNELAARGDQIAESRQRYKAEENRIMGEIEFPPGTVSLEVFLAKTVPDKFPKAQRMEIFREFLAVPNPAIQRGVNELPKIQDEGIGSSFVYGFAMSFRRWLEFRAARTIATARKEKSKAAHVIQYGDKWTKEALGSSTEQTLEMLITNTARKMRGDREAAKDRVQTLIEGGLIVKTNGKLYGIPGSGKSGLILVKSKPAKKK